MTNDDVFVLQRPPEFNPAATPPKNVHLAGPTTFCVRNLAALGRERRARLFLASLANSIFHTRILTLE
jgi:hypothetical protein